MRPAPEHDARHVTVSALPSASPPWKVRGPVMFAVSEHDEGAAWHERTHRLDSLVAIGEGKAAIDEIRRYVNVARADPPPTALNFLRTLAQYAGVLEGTDALAEADFIWTEALETVASAQITTPEAADAFLRHGLLLVKMHNYDAAIAKLDEATRRAEELEEIEEIDRQIIIARAWRGKAQAFEALGEFSQASNALDVLMNIKRNIRFIVFSRDR